MIDKSYNYLCLLDFITHFRKPVPESSMLSKISQSLLESCYQDDILSNFSGKLNFTTNQGRYLFFTFLINFNYSLVKYSSTNSPSINNRSYKQQIFNKQKYSLRTKQSEPI